MPRENGDLGIPVIEDFSTTGQMWVMYSSRRRCTTTSSELELIKHKEAAKTLHVKRILGKLYRNAQMKGGV